MKRITKTISLFVLLSFFANFGYSAVNANIIISNIEEKDSKIVIDFDILSANPEDLFNVTLSVQSANGKIEPLTLSGDYGENQKGGKGLQIVWDLKADKIYLDEEINIKVIATHTIDFNYFSYGGLMLSSTLLPGAGLRKIDRSKSYMGLSVASYGAVAAFGTFAFLANNEYKLYKEETDPKLRNDSYNSIDGKSKMAKYSLFAAAGIWILDYALLSSKWSKRNNSYAISPLRKSKLKLHADYNPTFKSPVFGLNLNF